MLFNVFLYPDTELGAPTAAEMKTFNTLEEATGLGEAYDGVLYEIQCISTTIQPPSKKYPEGERSTSKTILVRKTLRDPSWWPSWVSAKKAELLAAQNPV